MKVGSLLLIFISLLITILTINYEIRSPLRLSVPSVRLPHQILCFGDVKLALIHSGSGRILCAEVPE